MGTPKKIKMKSVAILCIVLIQGAHSLPDTEVQVLKDLHQLTNGSAWLKNQWLTNGSAKSIDPVTACTLPGVRCKDDHVIVLSLEMTFTGGVIPDSIGALSHLRELDLGTNFLSGSLPSSLGTLKSLKQFEADGNHFTGHIPASWEALRSNDCDECGPRQGAYTGGARVALGYNTRNSSLELNETEFGWECPFPDFLMVSTSTSFPGSNVASGWGLPQECGLTTYDDTPNEEIYDLEFDKMNQHDEL